VVPLVVVLVAEGAGAEIIEMLWGFRPLSGSLGDWPRAEPMAASLS